MYKIDNLRIINRRDKEYPKHLLEIQEPPEDLYCIGNIGLLKEKSLAVVGSRKCSEYGKQTAMKIGKAAAENNLVLVSGMAKGIDHFGHLGALKNAGKTIAVLGCGPDVCYPKENIRLYEQIINEGLIISELPPGTPPRPFAFPRRNRIISGLSDAVAVVEAGISSGALITAEIAASQGREVFAVPGNISSQYSLGTNKLITDGATAIAVIDDIFIGMGMNPKSSKEMVSELGDDEKRVYDLVKQSGEVTIDYICKEMEKTPIFINGIVTILEMKGLVAYNLGKIFIAKY